MPLTRGVGRRCAVSGAMYLIHALMTRRALERLLERNASTAEQVVPGGWQAPLALRESTPRPHARPVRQVIREERTHL